ncbi:MAG: stage II sporulation protein R [Candidatus Faecousia sp.]|nr:stage II sporulation protein R [Candidatus Faecousia sp.]
MKKLCKRVGICLLAAALVWTFQLIRDREYLNRELIRFHVVANSDSEEDQAIKLRVRDAVLESLYDGLADIGDVETAKAYLRENLPKIQSIANQTLEAAGVDSRAVATLCQETFDIRNYDTFTLPAGVYESLRIVIGEGEGKNWWCVAFPTLCLSATTEGFEEAAQTAGMDAGLTQTLSNGEPYQLRFYLLDAFGRLENLCFHG